MMKNPRKRVFPMSIALLLLFGTIAGLDLSRRVMEGEFERDVIDFEMLYSSEKGAWLEEIAPIFEDEWNDRFGTQINLILNPIGSGKGTIQVARGISKPVVWSPASRFWLPTLNYLWAGDSPIVDTNVPALVVSPTVIATWKSYQNEHNISSLNDLRELALHSDDFTYAHTDPNRSNSGFGGVIMQVATAIGKTPEEITLEDLNREDVHQWMRDIESAAIEYGSSTGFLAKLLVNGGPSKLKVALIYENLVLEKNKGIEEYGYNDSLVAVYPDEGTVLNDHPFGVLDAPWVSTEDKKNAQIFLEFLLREDIQARAIKTGFRPAIQMSDQSIEASVFNESVGVLPSLDNLTIYNIGKLDAEVLARIPDLWLTTRATDSSSEQNVGYEQYIVPAIILLLMSIIVGYPALTLVVSLIRRK